MNDNVKVVILAAGKGKRMKSGKPKSLIEIAGKSILKRLGEVARKATGSKAIAVIGHGQEIIKSALGENFIYATQKKQLGTAHALLSARDACAGAKQIAVLYADHPFVSSETIKKLLAKSEKTGAEITLASAKVLNFENEYKIFYNFARILRKGEKIIGIREYKDASGTEKKIKEVNPGYYVFKSDWLWPNLTKIKNENAQREYYLTDLLYMAQKEGAKIESVGISPREAMGANTKEELEILERFAV